MKAEWGADSEFLFYESPDGEDQAQRGHGRVHGDV